MTKYGFVDPAVTVVSVSGYDMKVAPAEIAGYKLVAITTRQGGTSLFDSRDIREALNHIDEAMGRPNGI